MTDPKPPKPKRVHPLAKVPTEALTAELRRRSSAAAFAWVPLEAEGRANVNLHASSVMGGPHRDLAHLVALLQTQLLVRLAEGLVVANPAER